MSRVGITNWFVNTIITALQAPEWDTLLERLVPLFNYMARTIDSRSV